MYSPLAQLPHYHHAGGRVGADIKFLNMDEAKEEENEEEREMKKENKSFFMSKTWIHPKQGQDKSTGGARGLDPPTPPPHYQELQ
jgi:hypothetical protein